MNIRVHYFSTKKDATQAFEKIRCDLAGIKIMDAKALFLTLQITDMTSKAAIILKQEMMALGGEVILPREVMATFPPKTTAIVAGTEKQYKKLVQKLFQQPFGCKEIAKKIQEGIEKLNKTEKTWEIKKNYLDFSKPIIMGIVNITPDSFSDGNKYFDKNTALQHCKQLIAQGADILDIGGESSRPGCDSVPVEEELRRIVPVIQTLLADQTIRVLISIDTTKPEVAEACLKAGVHIINDITGLQNKKMQDVILKYKCPAIMMHMQGTPKTMQENPHYADVVDDIISFFEQQITLCEARGISQIILDPGIGFGKTAEHNLQIIHRFREFKILGKPLMIGTSRKSFINTIIGGDTNDRLEGTIATNVIAALSGCNIFRVHDVKACKRALDLVHMIKNESNT